MTKGDLDAMCTTMTTKYKLPLNDDGSVDYENFAFNSGVLVYDDVTEGLIKALIAHTYRDAAKVALRKEFEVGCEGATDYSRNIAQALKAKGKEPDDGK